MDQMVKNLPTMWETWIQSLGWEDPLEEGMTTHSCILAWRIPWIEEPGGPEPMALQSQLCNRRPVLLKCLRGTINCTPEKFTPYTPYLFLTWKVKVAQSMEFSRPDYWSG